MHSISASCGAVVCEANTSRQLCNWNVAQPTRVGICHLGMSFNNIFPVPLILKIYEIYCMERNDYIVFIINI